MKYNVRFPNLGIDLDINSIAISFGNVKIYWYGVIIATGLLLAIMYAMKETKRYKISQDKLLNCVLVGIITAIIGARLYYVVFSWDSYKDNPISILYINNGGLAIYGGIIGALLGGGIMAKVQKMNVLAVLDIAMIGFLIGQGLGRWGNFMNQEAFGNVVPDNYLFGMISEGTGNKLVHPCFLYESVWCLLGVAFLHIFSKKFQRYYGQIFYIYLIWYGMERVVVEGLRTDSLYLPFKLFGADIRVSQLLSGLCVIAGIILLIINRKKHNFNVDVPEKIKT